MISVLMSVYNGEKYLRECLDSLLGQTLPNFELIVIDDGSKDSSVQILEDYKQKDNRIKVFTNVENLGLTKSLNLGLSKCKGKYIARMDADDICELDRFEKQFKFMETNQDVVLCGSQGWFVDKNSKKIGEKNLPTNYEDIKNRLLFNNQFIHSSIFFRKEVLEKIGGYNEKFRASQDYELVLRLAPKNKIANLPDRLINWRVGKDSISWKSKRQEWDSIRARFWAIGKYNYPKLKGFLNIILRLGWLILPQTLKRKRYS